MEESLRLMQARTSDEQIDESEIDEYNELMATDDDYTESESGSHELERSESNSSESCSPEGAFLGRRIVILTKLIEIYIVSVSVVQSFGAAESLVTSAALLSPDSCPTQAVRDSPHNSLDTLIEASESNFDELVDMNGSVDELDTETAFSIGTEIIETSTPSVLMVRTPDSIEKTTKRSSIVSECFTSNPLFIEETITDNPERLCGRHIRSTETSKG